MSTKRSSGWLQGLVATSRRIFPEVAQWVGIAGMIGGGIAGDPAIAYAFSGLILAVFALRRRGDDE
jgi:hypothetical protein